MLKVGIDKIGFYSPMQYVDQVELANARDVDPNKFLYGIGQSQMAVASPAEDVVAMAANAASQILTEEDIQEIDQIIVATESSFDYSKSIATYLHKLLNLNPYVRSYEVKQACYSGTAALKTACDYVRLRPDRKVLVVMVDIARYGLDNNSEVTQGAGAVSVLVTSSPRILAVEEESYFITHNQYDFWRPSYSDVALVDGHYSVDLYSVLFTDLLDKLYTENNSRYQNIDRLYFHQPFTKMGIKAYRYYLENSKVEIDKTLIEKWQEPYNDSVYLNRYVGNVYTASLYLSFLSALIYDDNLEVSMNLAFYSYGSGAVAELFFGKLEPTYKAGIDEEVIKNQLEKRRKLTIEEYEEYFNYKLPKDGSTHEIPEKYLVPGYNLVKISEHKRWYECKK